MTEQREGIGSTACSAFVPRAGSLWLVVVECRYDVVAVCVSGKGFYIPGQEPCWGFSHVAEWIAEIDPANYQSTTNSSAISSLPNIALDKSHEISPQIDA
jgi:hypothetical protein